MTSQEREQEPGPGSPLVAELSLGPHSLPVCVLGLGRARVGLGSRLRVASLVASVWDQETGTAGVDLGQQGRAARHGPEASVGDCVIP